MSVSLLSLNVERDKHWADVNPFLKSQFEQSDAIVWCFQEIGPDDFARIRDQFGLNGIYQAGNRFRYDYETEDDWFTEGVGILSNLPLVDSGYDTFHKESDELLDFVRSDESKEFVNKQKNHNFVWVSVLSDGREYTFGTTHFLWIKNEVPEHHTFQEVAESLPKLLDAIDAVKPIVFAADINIIRRTPNGDFSPFYKHFVESSGLIDRLPLSIKTTMDPDKFRKYDELVIQGGQLIDPDWIMASQEYSVQNIQLVPGISDHQAILAQVSIL